MNVSGGSGAVDAIPVDVDNAIRPGGEPPREATLYLDMTDLMEYVKSNSSLSGIQRVVANVIGRIGAYCETNAGRTIVPVIPEYDNRRVFAVDTSLVTRMIAALEASRADRAPLMKAIEAVYNSRRLVEPKAGDVFAIAGAFWIYQHFDMVRDLRGRGVRFVVFIHDLIQISHPEYVHEAATLTFRRALVDVLLLADAVLTNSEFVAEDVREFMRRRIDFELPVTAVPLATELGRIDGQKILSDKVRNVLSERYALSVSTIEVRKNHMYMVRVWEQLIRDNVLDIPLLVFAGKIGWDIEPFQAYLKSSDYLGGRLHVINDVTDYELSELYEHALFTLFPSFVEGFGLPVGESLAHGKPCIASNRASMPEVGGKFARYVDPENVGQGVAEVERLLRDPQALEQWTEEIVEGFRPRTWTEFVDDFFGAIFEVEKRPGPFNGAIEPGEIVGMGRDEVRQRDALGKRLIYLALARAKGWHPVETQGCWANSRRATLRFPTSLPANALATLYLMLQLPNGTNSESVSVVVETKGRSARVTGLQVQPKWHIVDARTDENGVIDLALISAGTFAHPDPRELFIGLKALAYCAEGDADGRMMMLERISGLRA